MDLSSIEWFKKLGNKNIEQTQFVLEDSGNVDSAQHGALNLSELISSLGDPVHFQLKTTILE